MYPLPHTPPANNCNVHSVGDWRYQHGRNYALHPVGNGDEHLGSVTCLCYLGSDDRLLASGCSDSYLRVWDLSSRRMIARMSAQEDEVLCVASSEWAPHVLVTGGADASIRVHDVRRPRAPGVCVLAGAESDVEVDTHTHTHIQLHFTR